MSETRGNNIRRLPKNIADKIAAGEVVTSPLSVVKELVENSLDAGAGVISADIENGGKSFIRVTDDGSGISSSEVELAFAPHATSKIVDESDLDGIATLGFRGEALSSIAAVSKLEMITKTADERVGTRILIEGGDAVSVDPVGAPDGTSVTVRDLFYNTPARLKFMKSDRGETTKIVDLMSRIATAYPEKRIRLITNGAVLFSTPGKGDRLNTILTVFGTTAGEDLIEVHAESGAADGMKLTAWISDPNHSAKTRRGQVFFVNGRYVKDDIMAGVVSEAYREFMFEGRYPYAYVFLGIAPSLIDVNVHPTKSEIKFADGESVRVFLKDALLAGLMSEAGIPKAHNARQFAAAKRAEREFYGYRDAAAADDPRGAGGVDSGASSDGVTETDEPTVVKISELWGEGGAAVPSVAPRAVTGNTHRSDDAYDYAEEEREITVHEPAPSGGAYPVQ
ncbi:MAG: DNA mismatch repair endonuclease MutL, partial [Clostridiales Family XIII bacterium]|nr:DNA mismatch repair endonuclease MutL [Clostridiales Family XIII bacterium]